MLAANFVAGETPGRAASAKRVFPPTFTFAKLAGAFHVGQDANLGNVQETEKLVFGSLSFWPFPGGRRNRGGALTGTSRVSVAFTVRRIPFQRRVRLAGTRAMILLGETLAHRMGEGGARPREVMN
jgi:hypothetical protein